MTEPYWEPLAAMAGGAPLVTALPAGPFDGQEVTLVPSLTVPTWHWHMKYVAALGKWIYLGGSPGFAEVITAEALALTVYSALTTPGPSFTLPVAGAYDVAIGCLSASNASANATNIASYDIGATPANDNDSISYTQGTGVSGGNLVHPRRKTGLTAVTLTMKYKVTAGTGTFSQRWISVVPYQL
jgi:hypothetical protein